ncbi:MAG: hypothetical protein KDA80_06655, partial [Planctomycetaceae bacterium]|nr:hypothetical protein [Planctomycetaceae bacterium]
MPKTPQRHPIQHPVFGRLIPDQTGEELLCFRQFPGLKPFWLDHSSQLLGDLEPGHRKLVKQWHDQPEGLAKICRNFDVLAALQSLGVFEVGIALEPGANKPNDCQVETYRGFIDREAEVCENICRELVNYVSHLRKKEPAVFEAIGQSPQHNEVFSLDEISEFVRFDGLTMTTEMVDGLATIGIGWDVDWDIEHGLQMVLHQDQP